MVVASPPIVADPRQERQIRRQLSAYGLGVIIGGAVIAAMAIYSVLKALFFAR